MSDQEPVDDELTRLRHLAFSREGTAADRARLAALESARRPVGEPSEPIDDGGDDGGGAAPTTGWPVDTAEAGGGDPPPRATAWTRTRVGVAAALGGLLLGAGTSWAVAYTANETPPVAEIFEVQDAESQTESSLDVFNRSETDEDTQLVAAGFHPLLGRLEQVEVRFLGDAGPSDAAVFAARGIEEDRPMVCLIMQGGSAASGGCHTLSEFLANGLTVDLNGVAARWGPLGDDLWVTTGFDGY